MAGCVPRKNEMIDLSFNWCALTAKKAKKYKEKLVDWDHSYKSKETNVITYTHTCKYSSGNLISIIQSCQGELWIKHPLEYLQI